MLSSPHLKIGLIILFSFFMNQIFGQQKYLLEVSGINSVKGNLMIGMFDNEKNFPTQGKQLKQLVVKVESKHQIIDVTDIVRGKSVVAFAVYHDVNANEKLDKNWFGVPTEVYGFSNNARGTFGPPAFDEAKIKVTQNSASWKVVLK